MLYYYMGMNMHELGQVKTETEKLKLVVVVRNMNGIEHA